MSAHLLFTTPAEQKGLLLQTYPAFFKYSSNNRKGPHLAGGALIPNAFAQNRVPVTPPMQEKRDWAIC